MNEETMRAILFAILKNAVTLLFQEPSRFSESLTLWYPGDNHYQFFPHTQ
jgi:hypothetical protein